MKNIFKRKYSGMSLTNISLLVVLFITMVLPSTAMASTTGRVYVSITNNTYLQSEGAVWDGVLLDCYTVEIENGDMAIDAVRKALEAKKIEAAGLESNYISQINGLQAGMVNGMDGWMVTLNDWFTSTGLGEITIENGDMIELQYSLKMGADLGGSWNNNDTSLKELKFDKGELAPIFSGDNTEYTLTLPAGTEEIKVTPTATNKNFQVRTYLNTYDADSSGYKRMAKIPVENGGKIIIGVGDPAWPTMNDNPNLTKYTITMKMEQKAVVSAGSVKGIEGSKVVVPIRITDIKGPAGGQFMLNFNPDIAVPTDVKPGDLLQNPEITKNLMEIDSGQIHVAFTGNIATAGDGELLLITFELKGKAGMSTDVEITGLKLNDENDEKMCVTAESGLVEVEPSLIYGDINGDGEVTVCDAILILKKIVGSVSFNEEQNLAGDVNGDGKISAADATLILRYVAEHITDFPVEQ